MCCNWDECVGDRFLRPFVFFFGAVKASHGCGDRLLSDSHPFPARSRDLGHETFKKRATQGCGGTSHFLEKSEICAVVFRALAVEFQHLSGKHRSEKEEKTGSGLFAQGSLVQRRGCKIQHRQRDPLVGQLLTDASRSLIVLSTRNEASGDGGHTGSLATFYVSQSSVLLSFSGELGDDDVAGARQSAVLEK